MLVLIAEVASCDLLEPLVAAWGYAGLRLERLHIIVDARRIQAAELSGVGFDHFGTHRSLALFSPCLTVAELPASGPHDPATSKQLPASRPAPRPTRRPTRLPARLPRQLRRHYRRRRGLALLARLIDRDDPVEWRRHARALARGGCLGIVRVARDPHDALVLARPLLACTQGTVRLVDIR